MRNLILCSCLICLLSSCNGPSGNKNTGNPGTDTTAHVPGPVKRDSITGTNSGPYTIQGDSVLVPPFEINVALSPKAKARVADKHETIIISVFLQGEPKDPAKAHLEEDGSFFVASAEQEITYGQTARFTNIRFPKKIYDQLLYKDVDMTIDAGTGRKTSPDNLITGDFLSGKVSELVNRTHHLNYKLIYGDN